MEGGFPHRNLKTGVFKVNLPDESGRSIKS